MTSDTPSSAGRAPRPSRVREFALHTACLALVLWAVVLVDSCSLSTTGRLSHGLKGQDLVQFYTLGAIAREGRYDALSSWSLFHEEQARHLPAAAAVNYPPVYGPQIALLFVPIAALPFAVAYALCSILTLLATLACVRLLRDKTRTVRRYPRHVTLAALAFPPLVYTALAGQISVIALAAFALLGAALARGRNWAGGMALGLLGYKVSLLLPAIFICLLAGEWLLALVAGGTAVALLGAAVPFVGWEPVWGFLSNLLAFARQPDVLAKPYLMASLRTFWGMLLPPAFATAAYVLSALATAAAVAVGWRRTTRVLERVGLLSLGTCLCAPHLYLYDLLCVVPAFLAAGDRLLEAPPKTRFSLRVSAYAAFLVPILALAGVTRRIPLVTPALVALLVSMLLAARLETTKAEAGAPPA